MVGVEARLTAGRESDAEGASDRAEQRRANAIIGCDASDLEAYLSRGDFFSDRGMNFRFETAAGDPAALA
jgi:hypothetical protein